MLLTVDIGNTTVAVAGFSGERPAFLLSALSVVSRYGCKTV